MHRYRQGTRRRCSRRWGQAASSLRTRLGESLSSVQKFEAKSMVQEMAKSNPSNTQLNFYWLPAIKAAIEIKEGYPARAITALEEAAPYELGEPAPLQLGTLYPAYLRGQAYLMTHNGAQAAAEFQKNA